MYALTSVILLIVINRTGSIANTGSFSLAYTVTQLLLYVGIFGVSALQITDYAERYSFSDYFWLRVVTTTTMLMLGLIVGFVLGSENNKLLYTLLLLVFMAINSVADLYQCRFLQLVRLDLYGKALFFRMLLSAVTFSIIVMFSKNTTVGLAGMILVNTLTTLIWCVQVNFLYTGKERTFSRDRVVRLMRDSLPLCTGLFFTNFILGCSKYGIEILLSDTEQGYFNLIFMPTFVINLFSQFVFLPLLNRYSTALSVQEPGIFRKIFTKNLLFLLALTTVAALGMYLLGPAVLGFLYGTDLVAYRVDMLIIMLGGGLFALYQLYYYIYVILKKQKKILRNLTIAAVAAVPLSYGLILWKGVFGACAAYTLSLLLLALEFGVSFRKDIRCIHTQA